jgi:hypothetical protein
MLTRPTRHAVAVVATTTLLVALALLGATPALAATGPATAAATDTPTATDSPTRATDTLAAPGPAGTATRDARQPGDAVIRPGGTYFLGQVLTTDVFDPGDSVELRRGNGSFVTAVVLQSNATVVLDTEGLTPGSYQLVDDRERLRFELVRQRYSVNASSTTVRNGGEDTTLTLTVESNRAGYTQVVSAPKLTAEQLRAVFDEGTVADLDGDGTGELALTGSSTTRRLQGDFAGVAVGDYRLRFRVPDTGAETVLPLRVGLFPAGTATLSLGDPVRVQQAAGRQLTGSSTLPDGTPLRVTVENASGNSFQLTQRAVVRDGTFVTTFDFSDVAVGQRFTVTVEQGPVVRDRVEGRVVRRAGVGTPTDATTDSVTLESVSLPEGGYVVVSRVGGERLGHSELRPAGEGQRVTVPLSASLSPGRTELVVSVRRDDGDGTFEATDPSYRLQGVPVARVVTVSVAGPTATVGPTATATAPTATATPTADGALTETETATATATATTPAETPGGGGPGLAALAAVCALGAVTVLTLRRRERGDG